MHYIVRLYEVQNWEGVMNRFLVRIYEFLLVFAFIGFGFAGYYYLGARPELASLDVWAADAVGLIAGLIAGIVILGPLAALIEISNDMHALLLETRKARGSQL